jgi:hypothetical protein
MDDMDLGYFKKKIPRLLWRRQSSPDDIRAKQFKGQSLVIVYYCIKYNNNKEYQYPQRLVKIKYYPKKSENYSMYTYKILLLRYIMYSILSVTERTV